MIAREVDQLLEQGVDSLVKVELVCFFRRNPSTFDTVHGLALRLGREEAVVGEESEALVTAEFLRAYGTGARRSFALSKDPSRLAICERLEQLLADRNTRLLVLARLRGRRP